jgi:hypothetical protein
MSRPLNFGRSSGFSGTERSVQPSAMDGANEYRRKAEALLRKALATEDFGDRTRFITEAAQWHDMATSLESGRREASHKPPTQ